MEVIGNRSVYRALMVEANEYCAGWHFRFCEFTPGVIPEQHHEEFISFIDDHFASEDILRFFLWADFIVWKKTVHFPYRELSDLIVPTRVKTLDKLMGVKGE